MYSGLANGTCKIIINVLFLGSKTNDASISKRSEM